jgi:hypothetical protein
MELFSEKQNLPEDTTAVDMPGHEADGSELEQQEEILEPEITKVIVYYGVGKDKKEDPNAILFYEKPDGTIVDVNGGRVLAERPAVLDHLKSRPINFEDRDIIASIVNGVMGDHDYETLEKAGLITDVPKRLWTRFQDLKKYQNEYDQLLKSEGEDELLEEFEGDGGDGFLEQDTEEQEEYSLEDGDQEQQEINALMQELFAAARSESKNSIKSIVEEVLREKGLISGEPELEQEMEQESEDDLIQEFQAEDEDGIEE